MHALEQEVHEGSPLASRPRRVPRARRRRTVAPAAAPRAHSSVVGGGGVQAGTFPWIVAMSRGCGGSLVAPDRILTAGHCVEDLRVETLRMYVSAHSRRRGSLRYDGIPVTARRGRHPPRLPLPARRRPGERRRDPQAVASPSRAWRRWRSPAPATSAPTAPALLRDRARLGRDAHRPARPAARARPALRPAARAVRPDVLERLRRRRRLPLHGDALRAQPQRVPPPQHLALRRRQRRPADHRRRPAGRHRQLRHLVRRAARADGLQRDRRPARLHRQPRADLVAAAPRAARRSPAGSPRARSSVAIPPPSATTPTPPALPLGRQPHPRRHRPPRPHHPQRGRQDPAVPRRRRERGRLDAQRRPRRRSASPAGSACARS